MLYSLFKKLFAKKIEDDIDLEKRLAVLYLKQNHRGELERVAQEEKDHYNALVDNSVENRFSALNFSVNPLHVFQLSSAGTPSLTLAPITREKAEQLKGEAQMLKDTLLWDIVDNTLRNEAIKQGLLHSKEWVHILGAKQIVYNLDIIKGIVDKMATLDLSKIPEKVESVLVK